MQKLLLLHLKVYDTNPELNAERESLNISEQELKVSRSSYLPTVTIEGTKSQEDRQTTIKVEVLHQLMT